MASIIHTDDMWQRRTNIGMDIIRMGVYDWRYIIAKGNIIEGIEAKE